MQCRSSPAGLGDQVSQELDEVVAAGGIGDPAGDGPVVDL